MHFYAKNALYIKIKYLLRFNLHTKQSYMAQLIYSYCYWNPFFIQTFQLKIYKYLIIIYWFYFMNNKIMNAYIVPTITFL